MATKPSAIRGAGIVGARYLRSKQPNPDGRMPLMDHLRELRNRVVKIALAIIIGAIVAVFFYHQIWDFVQEPFCRAVGGKCIQNVSGKSLVVTGVMDGFYLHIKIAVVTGAIATCPFWLYQVWAFIAPGLYTREKRWTYAFVGTAVPLFALGTFFAIVAMYRGLQFFIQMAGGLTALFTADTYIGYWIAMILGFGLCFEVPLVLVILNLARVVTHERFRKWRRMIIFLIFVFAGIASPSPDPITMLILGGIVIVLVELAEIFIYFNDKRYARAHPDLYADLADDELAPVDEPEAVDEPETGD